jgi:hypothetical protein
MNDLGGVVVGLNNMTNEFDEAETNHEVPSLPKHLHARVHTPL